MFSDHFTHYAQTAFTNRLPLLGKTGAAVAKRLSACPGGIRELLQFYYGFMPLSDAFTCDFDLFYRYAAHAASLRRRKRAAPPFRRKSFCMMWPGTGSIRRKSWTAVPFFRSRYLR